MKSLHELTDAELATLIPTAHAIMIEKLRRGLPQMPSTAEPAKNNTAKAAKANCTVQHMQKRRKAHTV